jgi:periplasmic protein TonB
MRCKKNRNQKKHTMSYILNDQQKMNEIIFAQRNKNYGAYLIRSSYGTTMFKSLLTIFFGFGIIMYAIWHFSPRPSSPTRNLFLIPEKDSIYVITCDLSEQLEEAETKNAASQKESQSNSAETGTRVSDTVTVEKKSALNSEALTNKGTGIDPEGSDGGAEGSGESGNGGSVTTELNPEVVHHIADKEPKYAGGLRALYSFLSTKLKYPEKAQEYGKEGTVFIRFVVDQKGIVGNLSLLNNLGYGLDEEAMRVVSMIPDFESPGIVDGKPVKVYYQLPIKFNLKR